MEHLHTRKAPDLASDAASRKAQKLTALSSPATSTSSPVYSKLMNTFNKQFTFKQQTSVYTFF
jgi:hypothetical protein